MGRQSNAAMLASAVGYEMRLPIDGESELVCWIAVVIDGVRLARFESLGMILPWQWSELHGILKCGPQNLRCPFVALNRASWLGDHEDIHEREIRLFVLNAMSTADRN